MNYKKQVGPPAGFCSAFLLYSDNNCSRRINRFVLSWPNFQNLVPSAHDVDFLLASAVLNCDLRSTHTTMSLNELRLSIFLLPEAGQTFQDPPAFDGDCILHSQFQGTQWRNPFQVL